MVDEKLSYGYIPPEPVREKIKSLTRKTTLYGKYLFILDHFLIWIPAYIVLFYLPLTYVWLVLPLWVLSIRSMRGLECLVHEVSHFNVLQNRKLGDVFGNLFAAIPVFSTVEKYRDSHLRHHKFFGTENDPDKPRHDHLELDELNRNKPLKFFHQIIIRIPKYVPGWWITIGTTWRVTLLSLFWHFILVILPVAVLQGFIGAIIFWGISFLIPFFFLLPFLRLIGESAEHDYTTKLDVAVGTYSNTGLLHRMIFHPHCDGFHTLHHLYPYIPHYHLPKLDAYLQSVDESSWLSYLRVRKSLFQNV